MKKRAIIVQARMSSSRLPGKSLRMIGDNPLLFYVLKRLEKTELPIIVATSDHSSDKALADYVEKLKFPVFRGDLENVLKRYIDCAEAFGVEEIIRVTGDNPLVDIEYLKKSLDLFGKYNYVDGIYPEGLIKGTGFELVTLNELNAIQQPDKEQSEHVTLALREKISFRKEFYALPVPEYQQGFADKIVLTCDYQEDLEMSREIFRSFGYSPDVSIKQIVSFYNSNVEIFKNNLPLHQSQF